LKGRASREDEQDFARYRRGELVADEWVREAMRVSYEKGYKAGLKEGQRKAVKSLGRKRLGATRRKKTMT
jgi:hypothetical protein